MTQPLGFLNTFKPPGITSTAFGSWVRQFFDRAPVGHWGTLDPAAAGVLVLAVGTATRLLPLIPQSRKQYVFELILGTATDTGDFTGHVVKTAAIPAGWQERLQTIAREMIGPLEQVPPMYSAVKVDGSPLYASARKGRTVARRARRTHVHDIGVIESLETTARLWVETAAGAYVRALCEELGERLGTQAHMGPLVRTAAGPFALAEARLPVEIAADAHACLIDPLSVLPHARFEVDAAGATRFRHGNPVRGADPSSADPVIVTEAGQILGVGRIERSETGALLIPTRVLA